MSGYPEYNYPAFHAAEAELRACGYETLNPASNPKPEPETWEGYMRLAIAQVVQADGLALLPGWMQSKGARVEQDLAVGVLRMPAMPTDWWLNPPTDSVSTG
jgi:hypothetical protein